jgi:hypothetical protein
MRQHGIVAHESYQSISRDSLVSQTAMGSTSGGEIEVVAASGVDEELIAAFNRLVPQLSRSAAVPTPGLIREIVEARPAQS